MPFHRQRVFPLYYRGELVGGYIADIVVDNAVILELKSVSSLNKVMEAVAGELFTDPFFMKILIYTSIPPSPMIKSS
jgi:hypothetical protein